MRNENDLGGKVNGRSRVFHIIQASPINDVYFDTNRPALQFKANGPVCLLFTLQSYNLHINLHKRLARIIYISGSIYCSLKSANTLASSLTTEYS